MAQCKNCSKNGFFLSVNHNGLCNTCSSLVTFDINQHLRILNDCLTLVNESKKLDTRLTRLVLLIQTTEHLMRYERKGIPTSKPLPSAIYQKYKSWKDKIILEGIKQETDVTNDKVNAAATPTAKVNNLNKLLLLANEYIPKMDNPEKLSTLAEDIKCTITKVQLDTFLDKARKAEFKGQTKKALDQYYEALYLLKTDDVDDSLQQDDIKPVEDKIRELGGEVK